MKILKKQKKNWSGMLSTFNSKQKYFRIILFFKVDLVSEKLIIFCLIETIQLR